MQPRTSLDIFCCVRERVYICWSGIALLDNARQFSKWFYQFTFLPAIYESSSCFLSLQMTQYCWFKFFKPFSWVYNDISVVLIFFPWLLLMSTFLLVNQMACFVNCLLSLFPVFQFSYWFIGVLYKFWLVVPCQLYVLKVPVTLWLSFHPLKCCYLRPCSVEAGPEVRTHAQMVYWEKCSGREWGKQDGKRRGRELGEVAVFWRRDLCVLLSADTSIWGMDVLASKEDLGGTPMVFSIIHLIHSLLC